MKQNMGSYDRVLRLIAAGVVTILYLTSQISGTAVVIFGLLAVIFLLTSTVGFCPLYLPLNISTKKDQKKFSEGKL